MRCAPDLTALAARLPARPLTLFPPSPTLYLCRGNVVNEIIVASPFVAGTFDPIAFSTGVVEKLREDEE